MSSSSSKAPSPPSKLVTVTRPSPGLAVLTLHSEPVNIMNTAMWEALTAALAGVEDDADVHALVIESGLTRDVFTAGNDITEIYPRTTTQERYNRFWVLQNTFLAALYRSRLATVAAIRGACPAGGCCLALVCDYRIFLEDARGSATIGLNEPVLGIPVPHYWLEVMKRTVGDRAAERLGFVGRVVGPKEALRLGLVDKVLPAEVGRAGLAEAASAAAAEFLAVPPRGRALTKIRSRAPLAAVWGDPARLKAEADEAWVTLQEPEISNALGGYLERMSAASKKKPKL
ncbi:ClpP/crotonase [Zopfochytrium polystomum]|nr:ClpP/crotonase [Zopfochytrium polystomum]